MDNKIVKDLTEQITQYMLSEKIINAQPDIYLSSVTDENHKVTGMIISFDHIFKVTGDYDNATCQEFLNSSKGDMDLAFDKFNQMIKVLLQKIAIIVANVHGFKDPYGKFSCVADPCLVCESQPTEFALRCVGTLTIFK